MESCARAYSLYTKPAVSTSSLCSTKPRKTISANTATKNVGMTHHRLYEGLCRERSQTDDKARHRVTSQPCAGPGARSYKHKRLIWGSPSLSEVCWPWGGLLKLSSCRCVFVALSMCPRIHEQKNSKVLSGKNSIQEINESFDSLTYVNGWKPDVYMRCMSQNLRLFLVSNSYVQSFRIFSAHVPGFIVSSGDGRISLFVWWPCAV